MQFFHRIGDRLTVFIAVLVRKEVTPAAGFIQYAGSDCFTVRLQEHGHIELAQAILVIFIVPDLVHTNVDLSRIISVGHVISADNLCVVGNVIFGDGPGDLLAVFILRQFCPFPFPVISSGDNLVVMFNVVFHQTDGDRSRAFAVLVTVIVPGLGAAHSHRFRCVLIFDLEAAFDGLDAGKLVGTRTIGIFGNRAVIDFFNAVLDRISGSVILIDIFETQDPVVFLRHPAGSNHIFTPIKQVDKYPCRADAVLVVSISPLLLNRDGCLPRRPFVGNCYVEQFLLCIRCRCHRVTDRAGVIRIGVFTDGIRNLRTAVLIFRQIVDLPLPARGSSLSACELLIADLFTVSIKIEVDLSRTFAFISGIIPGLGHDHLHRFRCVDICDGKSDCGIAAHEILIGTLSIDSGDDVCMQFLHRISDRFPIFIAVKIAEEVRPSAGLIQHTGSNGFTVCLQENHNVGRAQAILVFIIIPDLVHVDRGLAGCIAVRHIISADNL